MRIALSKGSTRVGTFSCLKKEVEPASETSYVIKSYTMGKVKIEDHVIDFLYIIYNKLMPQRVI